MVDIKKCFKFLSFINENPKCSMYKINKYSTLSWGTIYDYTYSLIDLKFIKFDNDSRISITVKGMNYLKLFKGIL